MYHDDQTWSCTIPGTARRKDGSCFGCVLVSFLPVTYCCHTSNVSFSQGNTIRSLETACKGCTRLYGTEWLLRVFFFGVGVFSQMQPTIIGLNTANLLASEKCLLPKNDETILYCTFCPCRNIHMVVLLVTAMDLASTLLTWWR